MVLAPCFYGYLHGSRHFVVLGSSPRESRCKGTNASRKGREDGGIGSRLDDARDLGWIEETR
jgi:hypothetical protein